MTPKPNCLSCQFEAENGHAQTCPEKEKCSVEVENENKDYFDCGETLPCKYHSTQPPQESWEERFSKRWLDDTAVGGYYDEIKEWVRSEKEKSRSEALAEVREDVEKLFCVYPSGNIHDFDEDEELISRKQVLSLLNDKK